MVCCTLWGHRVGHDLATEQREQSDLTTSFIVLMQNFLKIFKVMNPLIIYAWNGEGFDFPYLYYRLKKLGLDPNGLSNYGTVRVDYTENLKTHQKLLLEEHIQEKIQMLNGD